MALPLDIHLMLRPAGGFRDKELDHYRFEPVDLKALTCPERFTGSRDYALHRKRQTASLPRTFGLDNPDMRLRQFTSAATLPTALLLVSSQLQAVGSTTVPTPLEAAPLRIDWFGKWSYAVALAPYYVLLFALVVRYRVILRFATWKFFFLVSAMLLTVLGVLFEWIADILYVWSFPEGRDLFMIKVPIFGWFTGHTIPVCEFLWILGVVPLFYYLYLWATLVFYDVIYVVDQDGNTYKKEERWVGFHEPTRILTRKKGLKGREHERELFRRNPGFVARNAKRMKHAGKT